MSRLKGKNRKWLVAGLVFLVLAAVIAVGGGFIAAVVPMPGYMIVVTNRFYNDYTISFEAKEPGVISDIEVWNVPWELTDTGMVIKYSEAEKLDASIQEGWTPLYYEYRWSVRAPFPERDKMYLIGVTYRVNGELKNFTQWAYSQPQTRGAVTIFTYPPASEIKYADVRGMKVVTYNVWIACMVRVKKSSGAVAEKVYLYRDGSKVDEDEPYVGHLASVQVNLADKAPTGIHNYYAEVVYSDGSRARSQTVTVRVYTELYVDVVGCLPNQLQPTPEEVEEPPESYPEVDIEDDHVTVLEDSTEDVLNTEHKMPTAWDIIRIKLEELWHSFLDWLSSLFGWR